MAGYPILGLNIELPWSIDLPRSTEPADICIEFGDSESVPYGPDDEPLTMRRTDLGLELSIGGSCRMVVPGQGRDVKCFPAVEADSSEVRRQILEHLIPRLLSRSHDLVLHASSVVTGPYALGFVARSGSGKSTLGLAMARRGATMLGDDSLVIDLVDERAHARPLWSSVRIHAEDLSDSIRARVPSPVQDKVALRDGDDPQLRFTRQEAALRAVYVLGEADEIEITRLSPRAALLALIREAYHLEFDDMLGMERLMTRIERLGLTHCSYRLAYPRDFERLDEVCDAISAHAAGA